MVLVEIDDPTQIDSLRTCKKVNLPPTGLDYEIFHASARKFDIIVGDRNYFSLNVHGDLFQVRVMSLHSSGQLLGCP